MPDSDIEIRVEGTPNPNAAKFVLDRDLPGGGGSRSYFDPAAAASDPLATRLFAIDGVRALLLVDDFVTVTKREDVTWDEIVPQIEEAIRAAVAG